MVEFKLKINKANLSYIPAGLREILGKDVTVVSDHFVAIMYPSNSSDMVNVARSLKRLLDEMKDRIKSKELN